MQDDGATHGAGGDQASEWTPVLIAFLLPRLAAAALGSALLSGGAAYGLLTYYPGPLVWLAPSFFVVCVAWSCFLGYVAWSKERYELFGSHAKAHSGGLVSDQVTELELRNVTQLKLRLPWPRYPLFKVGDVIIESAGSSESEVRLSSILDPERAFYEVKKRLRENGFALKSGEVLHDERPDPLGVFIECIGLLIGGGVAAFFFLADLLSDFDLDPKSLAPGADASDWVKLGLVMVVAGVALFVLIHYLDLRRRRYRVYGDAVVYEEGFLTRDNALIPYENIADGNTARTLVDQVLGLYDVSVSCQGAGQDIKFRRLRRGSDLAAAISSLVDAERQRQAEVAELAKHSARPSAPGAPGEALKARPVGAPVEQEPSRPAWTAELEPHSRRAVVGVLPLLPLFPLWVIATFKAWLRAEMTKYSVLGSSVRSRYAFMQVEEREFSYDKVTGVVVKENPFDRMFDTVTVELWSIGSDRPLELAHLKRRDVNLNAVLGQLGVPAASPRRREQASFSLGLWFKRSIWRHLVTCVLLLGLAGAALAFEPLALLLMVPALALIAAQLLYERAFAASQSLTYHASHLEAHAGVWWRSRTYVLKRNVKKTRVTRYPGSDAGELEYFVAGEQISGDDGGSQTRKPYAFSMRYFEGIEAKRVTLDVDLEGLPEGSATPSLVGKPALGNSLARLFGLSLVTVAPLVLLPVTVPLIMLAVRRREYRLEGRRVVSSWGIVYRTQESVLYDRIDSLKREQKLLNKLFGNGRLTLFTAGSSQPDLVLAALPDAGPFYDEIRRHYRSGV